MLRNSLRSKIPHLVISNPQIRQQSKMDAIQKASVCTQSLHHRHNPPENRPETVQTDSNRRHSLRHHDRNDKLSSHHCHHHHHHGHHGHHHGRRFGEIGGLSAGRNMAAVKTAPSDGAEGAALPVTDIPSQGRLFHDGGRGHGGRHGSHARGGFHMGKGRRGEFSTENETAGKLEQETLTADGNSDGHRRGRHGRFGRHGVHGFHGAKTVGDDVTKSENVAKPDVDDVSPKDV